MNKHIFVGNLVRNPEPFTTQGGTTGARFTVAVRKRFHREGQQDSYFYRVTAWRQLGELCMKYLAKGRKVGIVGTTDASAWIGRDDGQAHAQVEVTADEVHFLSPAAGTSGQSAPPVPDAAGDWTEADDDELPFN